MKTQHRTNTATPGLYAWLILIGMLLAGCSATAAEPVALDTTRVFAQDVLSELPARSSYRIGINTEVTGTGAQIGDLSIRAARLAIEELNAAGGVNGRPLELVVRDCRSDVTTAVEQYQRAIAEDQLTALLGPFKSAYAIEIVPLHRNATTPMLIGATNATLTTMGDRHLFRMRPSDSITAAAMTALAIEHLGLRRIAIIHDADAFGKGGATNIIARLKQHSLEPVMREQYLTGSRDFDAIAQSIAALQPDAVLIYGTNNTDVGFLLRALRYWNIQSAIITSPSGATPVTYNIAAEAQDGIYVVSDAFLPAIPEGQRFQQRFSERFGLLPDTYTTWYYDAIYLLADAIRSAGDSPEQLNQALRRMRFQGAQGVYSFDQNGEGLHSVMLVRMQAGQPELVGSYDATGFQSK